MEKRVLVTGSSKGIGKAIARRLGENGWKVAVHYGGDQAGAEETCSQLGDALAGCYQADLGHQGAAIDLWESACADGEVHALVNNAGIYIPSSFLGADDEEFASVYQRTFAVNWHSPLMLMRAAVRSFDGYGGGKILNVASRVGFKAEAGAAIYAASKAALINLTRSLAVELAPNNIGMFGIAPGWVETAMARVGMEERSKEVLPTIPLGRMASAKDCAVAASFLLSDDASYLSGEVIDINGASYFH
ncbi:MAG TPA: SDR family oxidoreductase [Fimbriimonas sp.]|nr:SDR family oxidoreductase [Fimbriimonas sp.]